MEWTMDPRKNTYILRYDLPCNPIYDDTTIAQRMDGLIDYCIQYQIPAVMLYVDLHPYWYYAPDDLAHTKYYVEVIRTLIPRLRRHGISYQLNYQNLVGAWDGGADLRYMNDWEYYVDEKGVASRSCACGMGEKFRQIAGEKLRLWASTEPDVLWIDDDVRIHNHRTSIDDLWDGKIPAERLDFGCFCEKHIQRFNREHQTNCTRSEIVQGIVSGSGGNTLRRKWLDFSRKCMDQLVTWIEQTIHGVSPGTRVAVMTSLPDVHSVEGRNWGSFLGNLSGAGTPLLRPTFGPYAEQNPRGFLSSYLVVEQLKANIQYQHQGPFDFCPEIENTRFTRWSKSLAATGYQIRLSAFLGCKGVTLSIYDLEGCVLQEEPEFGELLVKERPFADAMAQMDLWTWESDGMGLITAPDRIGAACDTAQVREMQQLAGGRFWDETLLKAGIPCKYITPDQISACRCAALDGYTANQLTDAEIRSLLAKGLLLDAGAAEQLNRRGFSEYIGVTVGDKVPCIAASEALHTYRHTDGSPVRIPARIDGRKWHTLTLTGAEEITALVTPYGTTSPGITCFCNRLGGTVCVYAGNGAAGDGFYSNYRVRLLKDICSRLSGNRMFRMQNASYALMAVKTHEKEAAVFVANMAADPMTDVTIEAPYPVKQAVQIDAFGTERPVRTDGRNIYCRGALNLYDAFVCKIQFE